MITNFWLNKKGIISQCHTFFGVKYCLLEPTRLDGLEPGELMNFQQVLIRPVILLMATRNPARQPVEVGYLSHYLQGFIHPKWLFGMFSFNSMWRYYRRWTSLIWCSLYTSLIFSFIFRCLSKKNLVLSKPKWSHMISVFWVYKGMKYAKSEEFRNTLIIPFIFVRIQNLSRLSSLLMGQRPLWSRPPPKNRHTTAAACGPWGGY